ncbi:MAG TPA: hypothetical protein VGM10_26115 [Actinocrinis sp.]
MTHFLRSTGVTGLIVALIAAAVVAVSLARGSAPVSAVLTGPSAVASSILTEPSVKPSHPAGSSPAPAHPSTSPGPSGMPSSAGPSASAPPQTQQAQSPPGTGPASPSPSASPTFEPTSADLRAALLTAAQIPGGGFTVQSTATSLPVNTVAQCPALNELQSSADAEADISFSSSSLGPYISETLLQYSVPAAQAQIAQFAEVANSCSDMQFAIEGLDIDASLAVEPFPPFGDQTSALLLTADVLTLGGFVINGEIVGVRHGGTVIVISNVAYPPDTSLTPEVVSRALANVTARW